MMIYSCMKKIEQFEKKLTDLEKIVSALENKKNPKSDNTGNQSKLEILLVEKIAKLKPHYLIILILHLEPKQTRIQIIDKFKSLGATKKMIKWFSGGNFKQRLIDEGIVFEDGTNEKNKILYSLTQGKGRKKAADIINKLEK